MKKLFFLLLICSSVTKICAQKTYNTEICKVVVFNGINGEGQTPHFDITAYNSCFVLNTKPKVTVNGINSILFLGKNRLQKPVFPSVVCGFNRAHFKWHTKTENGWLVDIPDEYADCFNEAFAERGELKIEICYLIPVPVLSLNY